MIKKYLKLQLFLIRDFFCFLKIKALMKKDGLLEISINQKIVSLMSIHINYESFIVIVEF